MSERDRHYCPACGAGLVGTNPSLTPRLKDSPLSEPIGAPLRCKHCGWHLVTLEEWRKLPPFGQGYALYMQGSWQTSEIAGEKNPYAEDSAEWTAFRQGEQRAALNAQDGEE